MACCRVPWDEKDRVGKGSGGARVTFYGRLDCLSLHRVSFLFLAFFVALASGIYDRL